MSIAIRQPPFYWSNNGRHYVIYHSASDNIHYAEVGSDFDQETHLGTFYDPQSHFPEYNKAADAFLIHADNRWNMFYTVGPRLDQTIAYAFETGSEDIVIDNTGSGFSYGGSWTTSTSTAGYHGSNYLHDNSAGASPQVTGRNGSRISLRWLL